MATFDSNVEALRSSVATYTPPGGVDANLAWIAEESDGQVGSTGSPSLVEYGYYQISQEEALGAGIAQDTFNASHTDPTTSLSVGIQMLMQVYVPRANSLVAQYGLSWNDYSFGCLVKAQHALPSWIQGLLSAYSGANGAAPPDWDTLVAWGQDNYGTYNAYDPYGAIANNCEQVGQYWTSGLLGGADDIISGLSGIFSGGGSTPWGAVALVAVATVVAVLVIS